MKCGLFYVVTACAEQWAPREIRVMKNTLLVTVALQRCLKMLPVATGTYSSLSLDPLPLVDLYLAPVGLQ